jgi:hypothetical protein
MSPRVAAIAGYINSTDPLCLFTHTPHLLDDDAHSLAPDVSYPLVGDLRIDHRVRDRAMPHEGLQRPRIDSTRRQSVASSVPQHMSMDWKWQPGGLAKPFYELLSAVDR